MIEEPGADSLQEDFDAGLLWAAADDGAQGIVYMGPGPGGISTNASLAITELSARAVVTVVTHRTFQGANPPSPQPGT